MSPAWCVFLSFYYYIYWFCFNVVVENFGYQLALVYNFDSNIYIPTLGWENQHCQQNSEFSPFFPPMGVYLPECAHWPILPSKRCFGIGLGYCGEQIWKSVTIFRILFRVILCYFLPWTVTNVVTGLLLCLSYFNFVKS